MPSVSFPNTTYTQYFVECHLCARKVGLWPFKKCGGDSINDLESEQRNKRQRVEQNEGDDEEEEEREPMDILTEHAYFCPWVADNGWQVNLEDLLKVYSRERKLNYGGMLGSGGREGAGNDILSPLSPQYGESGLKDGQEEEEEEDVDPVTGVPRGIGKSLKDTVMYVRDLLEGRKTRSSR